MAEFIRTVTDATPDIGKKKKKKRYSDILRARFPKRRLRGAQEVPMDINKINASLEMTQKPHLI